MPYPGASKHKSQGSGWTGGSRRNRMGLPTEIIGIFKKDNPPPQEKKSRPRFGMAEYSQEKSPCHLCGEPRRPQALNENGFCNNTKECARNCRMQERMDSGE